MVINSPALIPAEVFTAADCRALYDLPNKVLTTPLGRYNVVSSVVKCGWVLPIQIPATLALTQEGCDQTGSFGEFSDLHRRSGAEFCQLPNAVMSK